MKVKRCIQQGWRFEFRRGDIKDDGEQLVSLEFDNRQSQIDNPQRGCTLRPGIAMMPDIDVHDL
jgi:hypothetical protein